MPRPFRVTVAALVAMVLILPAVVNAQRGERVNPDHPFAQLMIAIEDLRLEAEAIHILSSYCKPPLDPTKDGPQWEIDFVTLRLRSARRDLEGYRRRVLASFRSPIGRSYFGAFPRIDGIDPAVETFEAYFRAALQLADQVARVIAAKQQALNASPERDCARVLPRTRQPPPVDPTPPFNPAAGLTRPVPKAVSSFDVPKQVCSLEERLALLERFRAEVFSPALDNERQAGAYAADVEYRAQDLEQGGKPTEAQSLRRTEGRWADRNHEAQLDALDAAGRLHARIASIPIVECTKPGMAPVAPPPVRTGDNPRKTSLVIEAGPNRASTPTGGTPTPIEPAELFNLGNGLQTRRVVSHSLGEGAAQANSLGEAQVVPLDQALFSNNASARGDVLTAVRLRRALNNVIALGIVVQILREAMGFTGETRRATEQTRSSLEDFMEELISGGLNRSVEATTTFTSPSAWGVSIGGGVEIEWPRPVLGGWTPYGRAGVSYVPATGTAEANLVLDYAFTSPGNGAWYHERDDVTFRSRRGGMFGVELGGGVKKSLTDRLDLHLGMQTQIFPNTLEVTLETNPTRELPMLAGAVVFTPPPGSTTTILMSTFPQLESSLSWRLPETPVFTGSGTVVSFGFNAGIAIRF